MFQSKFTSESKILGKLAFPIIVGQLGQNIIALADTIMVGVLGSVALGASAFAGSVFIIFLIFGIGVLSPLAALFARMHGRDDYQQSAQLLKHSVFVALLLGSMTTAALFAFAPFLGLLGQSPDVLEAGQGFFKIIAITAIPSLIYHAYKQLSDGIGDTKAPMTIMLLGVVINILANYLLIGGNWGAPKLGLEGAAYATLFARTLMAVLMGAYVHLAPSYRKFLTFSWTEALDLPLLKKILSIGIPNGFTFTFEVGAFASAAVMMGWFGAIPLAAHQITISLASTSFLVTMGLGIAASIRVGYELGQNKLSSAKYAGITAIKMGAIYMSLCACFIYAFRNQLPKVYVDDIDVIHLAANLFIVVAIFQIFDGVQAVAIGALRGLSDTKWPSMVAFFAYWIMGLPLGYLMAFHLGIGPIGIWLGLLIGLFFVSILLTYRFLYLTSSREKNLS